jgi:hypothetical protein
MAYTGDYEDQEQTTFCKTSINLGNKVLDIPDRAPKLSRVSGLIYVNS